MALLKGPHTSKEYLKTKKKIHGVVGEKSYVRGL